MNQLFLYAVTCAVLLAENVEARYGECTNLGGRCLSCSKVRICTSLHRRPLVHTCERPTPYCNNGKCTSTPDGRHCQADFTEFGCSHAIIDGPSTAAGVVSYTVITEARNWTMAHLYCKYHMMDFATVRSECEHHQILEAAKKAGVTSKNTSFWIGGTELESNHGYYWVNDIEPLIYSNWIPAEPNGSGHCLQYWFKDGRYGMDDNACHKVYPFVCESRSLDEKINTMFKQN